MAGLTYLIDPAGSQTTTTSLVVSASARNIRSDFCAVAATAVDCVASPASLVTRTSTTTAPATARAGDATGPPPSEKPVTTRAAAAAAASAVKVAGLDQDPSGQRPRIRCGRPGSAGVVGSVGSVSAAGAAASRHSPAIQAS